MLENYNAIADYNQGIQFKPDLANAYDNRGVAKSDLGDNQGAIADYNQATGQPPDPDLAYKLWNNAHTATLEDYGLKEGFGVLFHPSIRKL